ncbi:MAG: argininosuccinate lyase, partial [Thermodesulfobacteriota bacterium]|nr:argininosuccinate lyase [Thermodesulfobacteriota bacterium]
AQAAARGYLNATDMADYLVGKGVAFRDAHACVGKAVAAAIAQKKELHELTLKDLKTFSAAVEADLFDVLAPEKVIERRQAFGGTAKKTVRAAIAAARRQIKKERKAYGL